MIYQKSMSNADCKSCCGENADHKTNCLICGKPLIYYEGAKLRECGVCHKSFLSNCECEDGHYVCDGCHSAASIAFFVPKLLGSGEKDPQKLLEAVMSMPQVHMHGPEHHAIVSCVLLTAYRNCGGKIALEESMKEAVRRSTQVPGGTCGYWGVCGAAVGAGIYMSVLLGSNPLNKEVWPIPQDLVVQCLGEIAKVGGPRCCKRTSRIAISMAAKFTTDRLHITMPDQPAKCTYFQHNQECLFQDCPFFPKNI